MDSGHCHLPSTPLSQEGHQALIQDCSYLGSQGHREDSEQIRKLHPHWFIYYWIIPFCLLIIFPHDCSHFIQPKHKNIQASLHLAIISESSWAT